MKEKYDRCYFVVISYTIFAVTAILLAQFNGLIETGKGAYIILPMMFLGILIGEIVYSIVARDFKGLKIYGIVLLYILAATSIVFFFIDFNFSWILLLIAWLVVGEILFLIDRDKPKKKGNKIIFTAERKGITLIVSALGLMVVLGLNNIVERLIKIRIPYHYWKTGIQWIGYMGIGLIIIAGVACVIYFYLWLNSLKYKKC